MLLPVPLPCFLMVTHHLTGRCLSLRPAETFRTEVPPLLEEASRQLRRATAAEFSADLSLTVDELACLTSSREGAGCVPSNGAGCSAAWGAADASGVSAAPGNTPAEGSDAGAASGASGGTGGDQRVLALALALCPPLALAATNPDNFLGALEVGARGA